MVRTVQVSRSPIAMAVDEPARRVYVSTGNVLDTRTGTLLRLRMPFNEPATLVVNQRTQRIVATAAFMVTTANAGNGSIVHNLTVNTQAASSPVVIAHTGHVVLLLESLVDDKSNVVGPGHMIVLDGRTGMLRQSLRVGNVRSFGLYDRVAVDNRTNRAFVIENRAVAIFDATRL